MTEQMSEMCEHCGGAPCDWLVFEEEITDNISNMHMQETNNTAIRKSAYKLYIYCKYGYLGKGNRMQISKCVVEHIRKKWPDHDENYMGFLDR